jgi:hypothetical protein
MDEVDTESTHNLYWDDELEKEIVERIEAAENNDVSLLQDKCDFCDAECGAEDFIDKVEQADADVVVQLQRC